MKTGKTITIALNVPTIRASLAFIVSPIRAFMAFIADKNPHGWCGGGSHLPLLITEPNGGPEIIDMQCGNQAAPGAAGLRSRINCHQARPPP